DYVLWYGKTIEATKYRPLYKEKFFGDEGAGNYTWLELPDGDRRKVSTDERASVLDLPAGSKVFAYDNLTSQSMGREKGEGAASWFAVEFDGTTYRPSLQTRWKTNQRGMDALKTAR